MAHTNTNDNTTRRTEQGTIGVTPPKYQHESYNENLYKWTERGVEDPDETDWSRVYFTCKFCPGRGEKPGDVDHSGACPVDRSRRTEDTQNE